MRSRATPSVSPTPRAGVIGVAHYSSTSQIALRLLTNNREPIDRPFFLRRLTQALAHRERVVDAFQRLSAGLF